jgi:hypothetical protein
MVDDHPGSAAWWPYAKEFLGWHVWRGISGLAYAHLRRSSPPVVVRAEGVADLRDQMRRAAEGLRLPPVSTTSVTRLVAGIRACD